MHRDFRASVLCFTTLEMLVSHGGELSEGLHRKLI